MRLPAVLLPLVLLVAPSLISACASSPGTAISRPDQTVRLSDGQTSLRIKPTDRMAVVKLVYPPDAVWSVMSSVLDSLGITVGTFDPEKRVIGNTELKLRGRLGSTPLSRYIDCGQTQGFASAETYDVRMSVLTQVTQEAANTSALATVVEAAARPVQFKGDYSLCQTTGTLEARIASIVGARLRK